MTTHKYPYTEKGLKAKEDLCDLGNRVNGFKIVGLKDAYDLAQIIKHLMVDQKVTLYTKSSAQQCSSGRQRTVEDLTITANSYGIKISFAKALKAVEKLYAENVLGHGFCGTVLREVHSPKRITITAKEIRVALGSLNVKNPNYVKPKGKSSADSDEGK